MQISTRLYGITSPGTLFDLSILYLTALLVYQIM